MTGDPNSCDRKPGGANACVGDKPRGSTSTEGQTCTDKLRNCARFPEYIAACRIEHKSCMQTGQWRNVSKAGVESAVRR